MTPDRWEQIKRLFHDALDHEVALRQPFLAEQCADDEGLRGELESLLASHEQAESFIEIPASDLAAGLLAEDYSALTAGQMVNHFRIAGVLASGGMGQVYLAEDTKLGRRVALKLLPAQFTADPLMTRRFEQEARAASALNHPNILTVYETGEFEERRYIAAEYVEGETLREQITGKRMATRAVLDVAAQVASALHAAHEAGIVHRDIKPENVMLRTDGIVKVLDFGLAKLVPHQALTSDLDQYFVETNPGVIMGTVGFMSPEQARGAEVDSLTDIWSLGVMLYEMLSGHAPFEGDTPSHVIVSILESEPPALGPEIAVPADLERIVTKALRKEKAERYQNARDMALDLKRLKDEVDFDSGLSGSRTFAARAAETVKVKGAHFAEQTAAVAAKSTADVNIAVSRPRVEYWLSVLRRHQRIALFALAAACLMVASLWYFSSFNIGSNEIIDSVAVLPFVNASGDPNTEYLAEGMSDSIISSLSRLPNLKVQSLASVLRYKGKQIDPKVVGAELNVRAVLVSSLTQRGEDLTISAELVDVRDNSRLWSGHYDRKKSDVLLVKNEIAREITERLRLRLSSAEQERLSKQYTQNADAFLLYNLGNYYFRQNTKEGWEKSIEAFQQALNLDPNYAMAYVGLAYTYQWMSSRGLGPTKEYQQKVELAAFRALQIDETLAAAHAYLGVVKFNNFDWPGAEKEIKRALDLDPNSPQANSTYSYYLTGLGRADEGLSYAIRARDLDPTSDRGESAFAFFMAHQYDKAIELYLSRIEKTDNPHLHVLLGEAYLAKGMPAGGVAEMQKGIDMDKSLAKTPERWDRYPLLAYALAVVGRREEALRILDEQKQLAKQRYVSPYNFAIIYTGLGDKDRAFEWLTKCVEERTRILSFHFKSRPLFDPLRSDPRYADLLRRMNLEP